MLITLNLMDLLLALLIIIGAVLGIFLIICLSHLIKTLKNLSRLTADLHDPLTQTVEKLPDLLRNVESISKTANETVPAILTDVKTITGTARAGVEAVGSAAQSVTSGVSSLFETASDTSDGFQTVIGIVGQVLQIVSFFTHRGKPKNSSKARSSRRPKKHRR